MIAEVLSFISGTIASICANVIDRFKMKKKIEKDISNIDNKIIKEIDKISDMATRDKIDEFLAKKKSQYYNTSISSDDTYRILTEFYKCHPGLEVNHNEIDKYIIKGINTIEETIMNNISYESKIVIAKEEQNTQKILDEVRKNGDNLEKSINLLTDLLKSAVLESDNNTDLERFCDLIHERLGNRIEAILNFYENTYAIFGLSSIESKRELDKKVNILRNMDSDLKYKINEIIEIIKNDSKYIAFICSEYINVEEKYLSKMLDNVNTIPYDYYVKNGITYHIFLRSSINELIEKYNSIERTICNKYKIESKCFKKFDTQDDVIIGYKDLEDLNFKIRSFFTTHEELSISQATIFCNNRIWGKELMKQLTGCVNLLYFDELGLDENSMYEIIEYNNEAFTPDGSFAPQLYMRYVIFIGDLSQAIKYKLEKFKNKSTIKFIYCEKN